MADLPEKNSSGQQLWVALLVLVLGGVALLAYILWSAYQEAWNEADIQARNYAELLEARFDSSLRRADADLSRLAERVTEELLGPTASSDSRAALEHDINRFQQGFPEISSFRVADAKGAVLLMPGDGNPVNVGDRDYFVALRDGHSVGTVFSEVLLSRINGNPSIVMARAVRGKNGHFLGVVFAGLQVSYFERLFDATRLGSTGALVIRRLDNHALMVRSPPIPIEVNQPLEDLHPLVEALASGLRAGTLKFVAQTDGVKRIYAFRRLEKFPFYVSAGVAESDVLANWRQRVLTVAGVSLMLFAGLVLVLMRLFQAHRRELLSADKLRRQQALLETAQRIAQLGSWEVSLATRQVFCSDEMLRIFELDVGVAGSIYDDFSVRVHPDDREMVNTAFQDSVAQRRLFQLPHRLLMPDGRIKHVMEIGETSFAADGTPQAMVGTTQDVTAKHHIESQMQLLASTFEHSGEAILISDRENLIVTVNPAFSRLTGYAPEEVVGLNPRLLSAGRTTPEEYREMWRAINERGFWQGEIWDRRKDGGVYPKWMSVSVIRDEDDGVRYYIAHFTDVSTERAAEAKLQHIAHHDILTGLLNRLSLTGRLDQALAAARREGGRVAVLFIDLDRFKVINDTLGHHIGDKLLIDVAERLRDSVRDSDVVARLGGDEFVVMLTGVEHSGAVATIAEKLVRSIGEPYLIEGYDLYTTPSIGISIFPIDGDDGEVLMKNADAAMYHAKAEGRNNFQFFDSRMNDAALERMKIEHSLRQALSRSEFCLHYQPVIDLASGRVVSVEALIRWQHPERGMVPPGQFIGIAEDTGLIQPIGEWVFWTACQQLASFNEAGLRGLRMGINISAMQLRNGNLPIIAKGAIEAFGLEPATLVFEITESVAMSQPDETVRILDLLHDMGVGLAIDDFGTGYSSLSYLRMFPIHHLKLDRSFVLEIGQGLDSAAICDATIGLAHNLGLKVVAEGVETEEQLEYLRRQGADMIQGYFYSRPVPADQVLDFIRQRNA